MTEGQARKILGVAENDTDAVIKKKYRRLIVAVHPDTAGDERRLHKGYTAREINEAYAVLVKRKKTGTGKSVRSVRTPENSGKKENGHKKRSGGYKAPENREAYIGRRIYQYAEGTEGEIIGSFCVAEGKYYWEPELEDFRLFMKSLMLCSEELSAGNLNGKQKGELIYFLAQQYIHRGTLLKKMAREEKKDQDGALIYYYQAMLEQRPGLSKRWVCSYKAEEKLYPGGFQNHRLYLKNSVGEIAGYLSFSDDRLYYIVIPLLEQKQAQIKIQISSDTKRRSGVGYVPLDLWIKTDPTRLEPDPGLINDQIRKILEY